MRNISLLADTQIWTYEDGPKPISQLEKPHTVYSPFGKPSRVWATKRGVEQLAVVHLDTGDRVGVGMSHQFMCRDFSSPDMHPVSVETMIGAQKMYLSPMPSRKWRIYPDAAKEQEANETLSMALDTYDDQKIPAGSKSLLFLNIDGVEDMFNKAVWSGFYGMTVRINPAKQQIELDENRPTCFPTKLLMNDGLDDIVNTLIDKQVLRPCLPYDQFKAMAAETGVFFEGYGVRDLRTLLGALSLEREEETWALHSDDPNTTFETAFVRT